MALFRRRAQTDPEATRMTLGEHLEELRVCVARSLIALLITCLACIWPSKYLLELIARPVVLVLRRHGQPDSFLATGPVETLLVYVKVVLIFGLVLGAPYILYQLWSFVAAGLYQRERQWVRRIVPISVGLFLAGVVFMYVFALMLTIALLQLGQPGSRSPLGLKVFRKLLEERKRDILTEAERAVGSMNHPTEETLADPTDRASLESDRIFLLRMKDRERKLLGKIDEAFARLHDGSYGRCEECGGEIGVERLRARPVTTLCIQCKSEQEEREKHA